MQRISVFIIITLLLIISGCFHASEPKDGPPRTYQDISKIKQPIPHYLPKSRYGNPSTYSVAGITYRVLNSAHGYNERGIASWYGSKFTRRLTSTRESYDPYKMTAASPVLPIPCFVRVTNLENNRSIVVKVNDRGPFAPNRIIDLSYAAATKLGYVRKGTALVDVAVIDTRSPGLLSLPELGHKPQLYLQVGAFSHQINADMLAHQVAQLTHKHTHIETTPSASRHLYRVQIGPINNVVESDRLQAALIRANLGQAITIIR